MPVTITFEPSGVTGMVATGTYLIDAAKRLGAPVGAGCMRGKGECSTCIVKVNAGADLLSPPGSIEQTFLTQEQLDQSLRLACHAKLEGDGEVVLRVIRRQVAAQTTSRPDQLAKEFGSLPLEKKIATLLQLEAITMSEALNAAIDKPLTFGAKAFDRLSGRGRSSVTSKETEKQ
ncbi:MAG TPA: 2Fe-2S iron-sulfur cluster binding domain-containing protein [Pyrinomonadaceae bacterium]|jgi:ferredoxin